MDPKFFIKLSRFRFWLYLGGTYIVGYAFGTHQPSDFFNFSFLFHLFYFLLPANLFLYGVNDYFDRDTDIFNSKKKEKEILASKKNLKYIKTAILCSLAFSLVVLFIETNFERILFVVFLLLSYFYSANPVRFKSKPIFDFLSNILYAMPGVIGYYQTSVQLPTLIATIGMFSWTSAMHLFSAIPDIESDKKANLKTTAVLLGKKKSLLLCFFFWTFFCAVVFLNNFFSPFYLLCLIYPLLAIIPLFYPNANIEKIYWIFPFVNGLMGFIFFLLIISYKGYL